ncbi:MAG: hypothetical protein AB7F65_07165 [Dehalococcoidia bacterium]
MSRYFQIGLLPVPLGLLIGVLAAATIVDRGFIGWVLCIGLGLMGGSFLAAIASGDALVGGPAPKRGTVSDAPWLTRSSEDDDR